MPTTTPPTDGRRKAAAARRRKREAEIIAATRAQFDVKKMREAQIDDIANAVGINRAIIYRHFSGKEELFALTLESYLDELRERLEASVSAHLSPREQLAAVVGAFVDFGLQYPAFVDCAQQLMRLPGGELVNEISESALYRLGRGISSCLAILARTLTNGVDAGDFILTAEPVLLANAMYASGLGAIQLARVGILVSETAPGVPTVGEISADQVRDYLITSTLALVSAPTQ